MMAKKSSISGTQQVINRLMMERDKDLRNTAIAVEATCGDIANDAKAGHARNRARKHAAGFLRYQSQTGNLTRSITPELAKVTRDLITGIVYSNMEYAAMVELGTSKNKPYPYLYPALMHGIPILKIRLANALRK